MTRAHCETCDELVDVDDAGRCPRGHEVIADDPGPEPWIGEALGAADDAPQQTTEWIVDPTSAAPGSEEEEQDELALLLADLEGEGAADGGEPLGVELPAVPYEDAADELAALAEELALRADSSPDEDVDDDSLGALDDAITAWDANDESIVVPSEPVPVDDERVTNDEPTADAPPPVTADELVGDPAIPPPPPPNASAPAPIPPPPPPSADDIFTDHPVMPAEESSGDEDAFEQDPPPPVGAPSVEGPPDVPDADEPPFPEAPRDIDLTNFTASGKRIDTSAVPRKRGIFPFGR